MRRMKRSVVGALLVLSLLLVPAVFAGDSAGDGWSLSEWVQDMLNDLFGGEPPEDDDGGDGLPDLGPVSDPAG